MCCQIRVIPNICSPTREEYLGAKLVTSCIDHINDRAPFFRIDSGVIKHKLADHYFVRCHVYFPMLKKVPPEHLRVSILDVAKFDSLANNFDWNAFMEGVTPHDSYNKFVTGIDELKCTAQKPSKLNNNNEWPWLTSAVFRAIKEKDKLWEKCRRSPNNTALRNLYKVHRNKVTALLRS